MAILNLTPDSFSDGGAFIEPEKAIARGVELLTQGARIIDIGAESTRPGSLPVKPQEEWERIAPVITGLRRECPNCIVSIDTRRAEVAYLALRAGADIINDVTGFQDAEMLNLASNSNRGLIAMRIRLIDGQIFMPDYSDPSPKSADGAIQELKTVRDRLLNAGIAPERVILDPGFGFGTTFLEDKAIWDALPGLPALLDWPIERFCVGISRKRFVARAFDVAGNDPLDIKTAEMHKTAANIGYRLFRTHSVTPSGIKKMGKKNDIDASRMSRPVHDIPDFVTAALDESGLWEHYRARPPYQQNDYMRWITGGRREETRQRRLSQMLEELKSGDVYMRMKYNRK